MAMDWTKIYKKYKGLWVALFNDGQTVVGSGSTLRKALKEAEKKGQNDPIVMRVPMEILPYIGSFRS